MIAVEQPFGEAAPLAPTVIAAITLARKESNMKMEFEAQYPAFPTADHAYHGHFRSVRLSMVLALCIGCVCGTTVAQEKYTFGDPTNKDKKVTDTFRVYYRIGEDNG